MQREMIGETIRKFRAERKLSREMLAEQTGIELNRCAVACEGCGAVFSLT